MTNGSIPSVFPWKKKIQTDTCRLVYIMDITSSRVFKSWGKKMNLSSHSHPRDTTRAVPRSGCQLPAARPWEAALCPGSSQTAAPFRCHLHLAERKARWQEARDAHREAGTRRKASWPQPRVSMAAAQVTPCHKHAQVLPHVKNFVLCAPRIQASSTLPPLRRPRCFPKVTRSFSARLTEDRGWKHRATQEPT